jgi:hypothetical protein
MEAPNTIALNLTFFATLAVAFVMFVGLFLVFVATLVLAGLGRLVGVTAVALLDRVPEQGRPRSWKKLLAADTLKPTLGAVARRTPLLGAIRREAPVLSEDWAAAVAGADARAAARARADAAPQIKVSVRDLPSPDAPAKDVTEVAPLVESATDRNAVVRAIPRSFQKPAGMGPLDVLDTGSLGSLSGHPALLPGQLPSERRRAG